ncbi:RNA-binding protein 12B-B-like [Engystomops pustulosus]|uniref:RNA-binding protein 12B-B-like n=1 Tax=Engystomops pustulosus TaxID=76066 RepID=UPI003AFA8C3B
MSLIVRLQGLPAVANSLDIREFFSGLSIPKGGVYITGGKYGEAFIIFGNLEDARQALSLTDGLLRDSPIHLSYSNEAEMKQAMEIYQIGLDPSLTASYNLNLGPGEKKEAPKEFSYLYVSGLSFEATRKDIEEFFKGRQVEEILRLQRSRDQYIRGKAIIKFGRKDDAEEALKQDMRPLCFTPVRLKLSSEAHWDHYGGDRAAMWQRTPPPSPSRERHRHRSRSRSPRRRRSSSGSSSWSPYVKEFYLHILNLSTRAEKEDIKKFLYEASVLETHIDFLLDTDGKRTRECFAKFSSDKDYMKARTLDGSTFMGRAVKVLPISKRSMNDLIERMRFRVYKEREDRRSSPEPCLLEQNYVHVKNFTSKVTKSAVQKFFNGLPVKEEDIDLLCDSQGGVLGEAIVKFKDEKEASFAKKRHNEIYFGRKIQLSCISSDEVKKLKRSHQVEAPVVYDGPDSTTDSLPSVTRGLDSRQVGQSTAGGAPPTYPTSSTSGYAQTTLSSPSGPADSAD